METLVGGGGRRQLGTSRSGVQYFETFCLDYTGHRQVRADMFQPLDYQLFDVPTYEGPINVVPLPKNGSYTAPPRSVWFTMGHRMHSTGF